jgi:fructose-bisphosphate aldolase class II
MAAPMLTDAASVVASAAARRVPVLAFNVVTLEHGEGVDDGAVRAGVDVIVQVSENAARYHGDPAPLLAGCRVLADASKIRVALHLDHITDEGLLHRATELGVSSVMVDHARLPYEANVEQTARGAAWARAEGLLVEAELGEIGGKVGHPHDPGVRTDPEQAAEFVRHTGVDTLAVAVGSQHAMAERTARLDLDLIRRTAAAVPVPLVLHGSSGVPDAELRAAAAAGIVKINIATLLNLAFTVAVRTGLTDPTVVDPRRYLAAARSAVAGTVYESLRSIAGQSPADGPSAAGARVVHP